MKEFGSERCNGTASDAQSVRPDDIILIERPATAGILAWLRGERPHAPGPTFITRPDPYRWFDPERGRQ